MKFKKIFFYIFPGFLIFVILSTSINAAMFETHPVGLQFGNDNIIPNAGENLIYGLVGSESSGGKIILLQKGSGKDVFFTDVNGNVMLIGSLAAGGYEPSDTYAITTPTLYAEQAQIGNPTGGLKGAGSINASQVCIDGSCRSTWSAIGGESGWTDDGTVVRLTTASDNVGIGTTAPGAKLHIADVYTAGGKNLLIGDDSFLTDIDIANFLGVYGNQNSNRAGIRLGSNGNYIFGDNGNIGIGTTSPTQSLTVNRSTSAVNSIFSVITAKSRSTQDMQNGFGTGYLFAIGDNASENNYIAGIAAIRDGADNSGKLFLRTYNAGVVGNRVAVDKTGNVGIGTETPSKKLHVAGSFLLSDDVYMTNNKSIRIDNASAGTNLFIGNYGDGGAFSYGTNYVANVAAEGAIKGNQLCIKDDCKSSWNSVGGGGWIDGPTMVTLVTNTNKVGIGTQMPSSKLEVADTVVTDSRGIGFDSSVANKISSIKFKENGSERASIVYNYDTHDLDVNVFGQTAATFGLAQGGLGNMRIEKDLGEGVTSPAILLKNLSLNQANPQSPAIYFSSDAWGQHFGRIYSKWGHALQFEGTWDGGKSWHTLLDLHSNTSTLNSGLIITPGDWVDGPQFNLTVAKPIKTEGEEGIVLLNTKEDDNYNWSPAIYFKQSTPSWSDFVGRLYSKWGHDFIFESYDNVQGSWRNVAELRRDGSSINSPLTVAGKISGVLSPTAGMDAVNKDYVDAAVLAAGEFEMKQADCYEYGQTDGSASCIADCGTGWIVVNAEISCTLSQTGNNYITTMGEGAFSGNPTFTCFKAPNVSKMGGVFFYGQGGFDGGPARVGVNGHVWCIKP